MSAPSHSSAPLPGIERNAASRRSVLAAGGWAVPAVIAVVASPAASASGTVAWDLALDPPQMGSSHPLFNEDFTRLYEIGYPVGYVVANHGTAEAPAGSVLVVTYDARLWSITGMDAAFRGTSDVPVALSVTHGGAGENLATATAVIPFAIPAGTDSFSGLFVRFTADFLAAYPNDGISAPLATTLLLQEPGPETDPVPANNAVGVPGDPGYVDQGPVNAWGAVVEAQWQRRDYADGYLHRVSSFTVSSTGPTPLASGDGFRISTDERLASGVTLSAVTLDGIPADGLLVPDGAPESWFGLQLTQNFLLTAPIPAGSTFAATVSYQDVTPQGAPTQLYPGQTGFVEHVSDPSAQRAIELSYVSNEDYSPQA